MSGCFPSVPGANTVSICHKIFQDIGHQFLKYAGACASPNGTLMYLYFPNGELKAVFGMEEVSNSIW